MADHSSKAVFVSAKRQNPDEHYNGAYGNNVRRDLH